MIITVDIGNTSIRACAFSEHGLKCIRTDTHPLKNSSEYSEWLSGLISDMPASGMGSAMCCVVPSHEDIFISALKTVCQRPPVVASHMQTGGLTLDIDTQSELGADRIASAVAASSIIGGPVCVLDFGTATTVNFVSEGAVFEGGAILPGLNLMATALSMGAEKLGNVQIRDVFNPCGKNTEDNILSGIIYGTAGAVQYIIGSHEARTSKSYAVAATGGAMHNLLRVLKRVDLAEPNLTMLGLKIIYGRSENA